MSIRVWLADDHAVVRQALRMLLDAEPDITVIGETGDGISTLEQVKKEKPDVAVVDIVMPNYNGIEITRELAASVPEVAVVILSMYKEDRYVLPALRAGAIGYVSKQSANTELLMAIRAAKLGESFLSPSVASTVIAEYIQSEKLSLPSGYAQLTRREQQVFQLIGERKSSQEIARALDIRTATVGTHKGNLMSKLDIHTTAGLVRYALRHNLVSLDDE